MSDQALLKDQLNNLLRQKLKTAFCVKGQLEVESTVGAVLVVLRGEREDGKPVYFWNPDAALKNGVDRYLKSADDTVAFHIDIDVLAGSFVYNRLSAGAMGNRRKKEEKGKARESARQQKDLKTSLQSLTVLYGPVLAGKVAEALQTGGLAYSHRDYCGMGLEKSGTGEYWYGEVWDGVLDPKLRFSEKAAFVDWLSVQSDASLSGLEEKDPFYWGNQCIDRKRLEEFAGMG